MTFRCIWTPPGAMFPTYVDYRDRDAANLAAIRLSRELKTEVEVHDLDVGSIGSSRMHQFDERRTCQNPARSVANGRVGARSDDEGDR